jgi:hypothetical protein
MPATVSSKEMSRHSGKISEKKEQAAGGKIKSIELEPVTGGGHMITHRMDNYESAPKKFFAKNHSAVKKHLDKHCPDCGADVVEPAVTK